MAKIAYKILILSTPAVKPGRNNLPKHILFYSDRPAWITLSY